VSRLHLARVAVILTLLVCALTWPQCLHLGTQFAWHNDPQFSIWRLAWIAHALRVDPGHLFDANIFYPARQTLAYSDATLFEGAIAAPLFWMGAPPVVIYNLLLLTGFVGSGVAMFVLVHHVTKNDDAALVGAAIFVMVPYRIEHFGHLELQWAMWIPLAFWALHHAVDEGSWRFGALAGIFLWLQTLSCVYYGVFLAFMMALLGTLLVVSKPQRLRAALLPLALGALLAAMLTTPYAMPYLEAARSLGPRDAEEIARYSARPINYLAAPSGNWIWGWTGERFGGAELILLPGVIAVALGVAAFVPRARSLAWIYAAVCAAAVELSLGTHTRMNAWLFTHLPLLAGLRVWARCSIVAYCALAVLSAIGVVHIERQFVP